MKLLFLRWKDLFFFSGLQRYTGTEAHGVRGEWGRCPHEKFHVKLRQIVIMPPSLFAIMPPVFWDLT